MSWLKNARVKQGLTQIAVADHLGISRPTYASLEADPGRLTVEQVMELDQLGLQINIQGLTPVSCPACDGSGLLYRNNRTVS